MKCYVAYKVEPLTRKQILRCDKGTCNHVPLFCSSWQWLTKLVGWCKGATLYHESLDETGETESVDDDSYQTVWHPETRTATLVEVWK